MGRVLCLDIGTKRIGVAQSDETQTIASARATLGLAPGDDPLARLEPFLQDPEVEEVVVGLPRALDGRATESTRIVCELVRRIEERFGKRVVLLDERLSTAHAHRLFHELDKKPSRDKSAVDRLAALLILESYLERKRCRK